MLFFKLNIICDNMFLGASLDNIESLNSKGCIINFATTAALKDVDLTYSCL